MHRIVLLSGFITLFLTSCVPQHKMVWLSPGGEKIILIDADLPPAIPGRPLDNCTVLSQLNLVNSDQSIWYTTDDWDNALRNKTAESYGNVAVRIAYDLRYGLNPYSHSVQGMALRCPEDVLKAAGLEDGGGYSLMGGEDEVHAPLREEPPAAPKKRMLLDRLDKAE